MIKPLIFTKREQLVNWVKEARLQQKSIGFVPTMGALHKGHAQLMQQSAAENDVSVLSIFVNPKQFGPSEDFGKYPRTLDSDISLAGEAGMTIIFAPSMHEMYPPNFCTNVMVANMSKVLCGASRAGHFDGVCTVVLLLLNLVMPNKVYFGLKDYQQLCIISKMCADLSHPSEIIPVPTVRENDGLAMSSRNIYLDEASRKLAKNIPIALATAAKKYFQGERNSKVILQVAVDVFAKANLSPQYLEIRDAETLQNVSDTLEKPVVMAIALPFSVETGICRLIDNVVLADNEFYRTIAEGLIAKTLS